MLKVIAIGLAAALLGTMVAAEDRPQVASAPDGALELSGAGPA